MNSRSRIALALGVTGLSGTLAVSAGVSLLAVSCTFQSREAPELAAPAPMEEVDEAGAMDTGLAPPPPAAPAAKPRPAKRPAPATKSPKPVAPPRDEVDTHLDQRVQKPAYRYDFGGSTYLSNDDSMSLASAQRLLWALQRGEPIAPSQIRKHELLNYFTFDSTPPARGQVFGVSASAEQHDQQLDLALVVEGLEPDPQPLDLTVLIDRSGSMDQDGRMQFTQRGLRLMLEQLRPGDTVDILTFAAGAEILVEDFVVGDDSLAELRQTIDGIVPRGSTDLSEGLRAAYDVARGDNPDPHRNRRLLLITDAQTNRGVQDEHLLSEVGRHLDEAGVRLTGVGVGKDFDDALLDRLTEKGKGAYVFLGSDVVVDRVFGVGFPALVNTIAHDVRFQLHLPDSLAMKRFHGEEMSKHKKDIQPVHFFAGNTQTFFSELAVADDGLQPGDAFGLDITWRDPATGEPRTQKADLSVAAALDASPYNVRKARTLMAWSDVLTAHASRVDCAEPLDRFTAHSGTLDDPEIAFVADLAPSSCRVPERVAYDDPVFAPVTFRVSPSSGHTRVELRCHHGYRQRATLNGGVAVFEDAPPPQDCQVQFKGGTSADTTRLGTGRDYVCTFRSGVVTCNG